jgi:hypothetical protein
VLSPTRPTRSRPGRGRGSTSARRVRRRQGVTTVARGRSRGGRRAAADPGDEAAARPGRRRPDPPRASRPPRTSASSRAPDVPTTSGHGSTAVRRPASCTSTPSAARALAGTGSSPSQRSSHASTSAASAPADADATDRPVPARGEADPDRSTDGGEPAGVREGGVDAEQRVVTPLDEQRGYGAGGQRREARRARASAGRRRRARPVDGGPVGERAHLRCEASAASAAVTGDGGVSGSEGCVERAREEQARPADLERARRALPDRVRRERGGEVVPRGRRRPRRRRAVERTADQREATAVGRADERDAGIARSVTQHLVAVASSIDRARRDRVPRGHGRRG